MHAIAHGGVRTPYESTLKFDSGRKIPCRTGGIEPASAACQSDAVGYQLNYIPKPKKWCVFYLFPHNASPTPVTILIRGTPM